MTYQPLGKPRFFVEPDGETIRVPARKQWASLLFLPFWLVMWTVGGGFAIVMFVATLRSGNLFVSLFLLAWLGGWVFGEVSAVVSIAWMLIGSETLRVVGGDLEIARRIGPWVRSKLFRGSEIRDLRAKSQTDPFAGFRFAGFGSRGGVGAVQFAYGARTVYAASDLDEAEGKAIVETLKPRLPRTASEAGSGRT